ncbi:hypothetical protein VP01_153g6 [Puccinia sorghi]|uniref:Uncharacterized protein n=1 Tax=Puccinia sorghi TaxID=27349 RepID=A0A0L6VIJ5_9BASI|nr:hypothetical protein VP01_153g6 [Puccinia sorghi]
MGILLMAVEYDTFNCEKWENFLEWDLGGWIEDDEALNPLELCFAGIKNLIFRTQSPSSSTEPDWDLRKTVSEVISCPFCHTIYGHCGYSVPQFPLLCE